MKRIIAVLAAAMLFFVLIGLLGYIYNYPRGAKKAPRERVATILKAAPTLLIPVVIVGSILSGLANATESAARHHQEFAPDQELVAVAMELQEPLGGRLLVLASAVDDRVLAVGDAQVLDLEQRKTVGGHGQVASLSLGLMYSSNRKPSSASLSLSRASAASYRRRASLPTACSSGDGWSSSNPDSSATASGRRPTRRM